MVQIVSQNYLAVARINKFEALGKRVRQLREAYEKRSGRNFYQRSAAAFLDVTEDTYRAWEYGKSEFPESAARALADRYGISWEDFYAPVSESPMTQFVVRESRAEIGRISIPISTIVVPIPYAGTVNAGAKLKWTDPYESEDTRDLPPEMAGKGHWCCEIEGDSCFDLLWPNDTAVFRPDPSPAIGQMVYFRDRNNFVTVKQLKHNGKDYILHALNPKYPDEVADGQAVGYLIGIYRKNGTMTKTFCDLTGIRPESK